MKKLLMFWGLIWGSSTATLAEDFSCLLTQLSNWGSGSQYTMQVINNTSTAKPDWEVKVFYPDGHTITNSWQISQTNLDNGETVFVDPANNPLQPGDAKSFHFGFQIDHGNLGFIEPTVSQCVVHNSMDSDKDGVDNDKDLCPETSANESIDEFGCSINSPEREVGYNAEIDVTIEGVDINGFNATNSEITFRFSESFPLNAQMVKVYQNGSHITSSPIIYGNDFITLSNILMSGKNLIEILAITPEYKLIEKTFIIWAGTKTVSGFIRNMDGELVAGEAIVTATLNDENTITSELQVNGGAFTFLNVPNNTVLFQAVVDGNFGIVGINGGDTLANIAILPFNEPSLIDNNDFSLGTLDGWEINGARVSLSSHQEELSSELKAEASLLLSNQKKFYLEDKLPRIPRSAKPTLSPVPLMTNDVLLLNADQPDLDLDLTTAGEGVQRISRTFNTSVGTQSVTVRYRFITSEVPGGYFGTQFNDYFSVSIRSMSGGIAQESNSMNGLGLPSFDAVGATTWREETLEVNPNGDTIQIDLAVANVGDGALDSTLRVDLIEENQLRISELTLNDIDNTPLNYLSASQHTYFNGNTRIHATITIEGAAEATISEIMLEVIQGGSVVVTGTLTPTAQNTLLQQLGNDGRVAITGSQHLFDLVPTGINSANNGQLALRVKVTSSDGEEVIQNAGNVTILRRFLGSNRYGVRDTNRGGDDWALPSVLDFVDNLNGYLWGDFSNMNAGSFAPDHTSHQTGVDADGWFNGYNARNAATAAFIIAEINASNSRISRVYVTFERVATDTFFTAIQNVVLTDGRAAVDVIIPATGHRTHVHYRLTEN